MYSSYIQAHTIEEEVLDSPSHSPIPTTSPLPPADSPIPPTSPLPLAMLTETQADMRARVSSVSGRPIRSTGICLQFGEDESSSESDLESTNELGELSCSAEVKHASMRTVHLLRCNLLTPTQFPSSLVCVHEQLQPLLCVCTQFFSVCCADVNDRLSQGMPFTGGTGSPLHSSGLLLPPQVSPDIMAPGNLRRAGIRSN